MHRDCIVLRGEPAETGALARRWIPDGATVLWVSDEPEARALPPGWIPIDPAG